MTLIKDRELVDRMLSGDQRAFNDFFNAFSDRIYRFALVRLNDDPTAAEDAAQQTLCRAVEKLHQFKGESALFTWLCQICRNAITDCYRSSGIARSVVIPFDDSDEVRVALEAISAIETNDPHELAISDQVQTLVRAVLDYLPTRYGQVLEWKYMQGMSVKEIASQLKVGQKAAESTLNRARLAFREGVSTLGNVEAIRTSLGLSHE